MQVARKKTANEVWDCLKTRFIGVDRVKNARLQMLKSDFNAMHMQEGESLGQYTGRLNGMSFYDLDKMQFEEAVGQLKAPQKKDGGDSSSSNKGKSHLAVDSSNRGQGDRGRDRGCARGGHGGTSRNDEESGSSSDRHNKSHIKCYNCYMMGHYANECKVSKKKEEETHLTRADDTVPALLLMVSEEPAQEWQHQRGAVLLNEQKLKPELHDAMEGGSSSEVWYMNNGASNHMTSEKEKFRNLDECVTSKVKFGDSSTVQIMGLWSIMFSYKNGDQ
ncbi:uncharacterized protein LOC133918036 [Phragmites australis]|uniref:uncharacterized protein LOC133918036 n=1 Tax=Phragmites australis TaxID=29695 RepID=UPI002D79618B|nr:uncharacterized protein LOC133918036 [Phragmites australis]